MQLSAVAAQAESLTFSLHPSLRVKEIIRIGEPSSPIAFRTEIGKDAETQEPVQWIEFRVPQNDRKELVLEWRYEGIIQDPPKEPRHLRFVTSSETSGHIGPEGVYLSGETRWYPDLAGSLPTFRVQVATPAGWEAVTHGRQISQRTESDRTVTGWDVTAPTEALTLVANRFVAARRLWKGIELATYLFPEDAALADEYLDATTRYLDAYTKVLGPYPFPKFAVVENFFASGLGMPSFTLLGSGVIKRHYTQPYALGHEIVHSWIGNCVLNDPVQGNWVEGLTTYLANYYYEEMTGTPAQAREQRRMMVLGYAVYVKPEDDYPIAQFRRKVDQKDNAIGYQKTAMVFHMLRREIGDAPFWAAVRDLVALYSGRYATWKDLESVFARVAGKDLRGFFAQWIERSGAPTVRISHVSQAPRLDGLPGETGHHLQVTLSQSTPVLAIQVPLVVKLEDGSLRSFQVAVDGASRTVELPVPSRAKSVTVDAEFELFRRIPRSELPPMLNLYATDGVRTVVVPTAGAADGQAAAAERAAQIASRSTGTVILTDKDPLPQEGSLLVLGGPGANHAAGTALAGCGRHVTAEPDRFTVGKNTYEGAGMGLLVSCPRPGAGGRVATVLYGLSPSAISKVGRLLFFYGWQSYVVFRDGAVVARGDFPVSQEGMEVAVP